MLISAMSTSTSTAADPPGVTRRARIRRPAASSTSRRCWHVGSRAVRAGRLPCRCLAQQRVQALGRFFRRQVRRRSRSAAEAVGFSTVPLLDDGFVSRLPRQAHEDRLWPAAETTVKSVAIRPCPGHAGKWRLIMLTACRWRERRRSGRRRLGAGYFRRHHSTSPRAGLVDLGSSFPAAPRSRTWSVRSGGCGARTLPARLTCRRASARSSSSRRPR
jgi:hypothetical protein